MKEKMLQIIPADGWFAVHKNGEEVYHVRLVCWALCEDEDGLRSIDGVEVDDTGVDGLSTSFSDFSCYLHESGITKLPGEKI